MASSLYVHVPFCRSRCAYCGFYSGEPLTLLDAYPGLVAAEAALRAPTASGPLTTVYFGGGTPSLLSPRGVERVLRAVDAAWGIAAGAEVTLEVNPSAAVDFRGIRCVGVTRLSVGAQALDDRVLRRLGRAHRAADVASTLAAARRAGFDNLGADLLYGLPDLPPEQFAGWVRNLAALGAAHLSAYSLEVHPDTPLARRLAAGAFVPAPPAEEEAHWHALAAAAADCGYRPYEVSNFALPGFHSRHNEAYWSGNPYLALGPGAHAYDPARGPWGTRSWNDADLPAYARHLARGALPPGGGERLTRRGALLEALFLGLRRAAPLDAAAVSDRFHLPAGALAAVLRSLAARGLLDEASGDRFRPGLEAMRRGDGLALWVLDRVLPGP